MAESFKLPVASLEELLKILQAYANEKEGAILSLDDISQSTGMQRTIIPHIAINRYGSEQEKLLVSSF